jgi:hypothetical protein
MPAITTRTPAGAPWRVRVVWLPRWRPLVRRFGGWKKSGWTESGWTESRATNPLTDVELPDLDDGPDYTPLVRRPELMDQPRPGPSLGNSKLLLTLVIVLLVLGGAVVWWVLLPLVLLIADALTVAALVLVGVPIRVARRRRFTVEATSPVPNRAGTMVIATQVPGWTAAHRRRDEIAAQLGDGVPARTIGRIKIRA